MSESYVTIAVDDISCLGCLVLCNSLKKTGTEKKLSVLVNDNVSDHLRSVLQKSFDYVFFTKDLFILNKSENPLNKFEHSEKLKCWLLSQFTKCIFLESDVLVVENIDNLFERSELSAASDPRWPDYFDIGVFVYEPSQLTYSSLIDFSLENKFQNNSIQCLLNAFFNKWSILDINHKIPFTYNCQLNYTFYTHTNALLYFGSSIKAARLGNSVMQMMQPSTSHDSNYDHWNKLWLDWWKIFNEMVKPALMDNEVRKFTRISYEKNNSYNSKESFVKNDNSLLNRNNEYVSQHSNDQYQNSNTISANTNLLDKEQNLQIHCNSEFKNSPEVICYAHVQDSTNVQYDLVIDDHNITENKSEFYLYLDDKNKQEVIDLKEFNDVKENIEMKEYHTEFIEENIDTKQHKTEFIEEISHCILPLFEDIRQNEDVNIQQSEYDETVCGEDTESAITILENEEENDNDHRQQWERGEIDYMGKDSFQNILLKLTSFINQQQNNSKVQPEE